MEDFWLLWGCVSKCGELNTARDWEHSSASARSAAPWPWTSRLARCLRWSRFWCLWTCCWCSSSVLVKWICAWGPVRSAAHFHTGEERTAVRVGRERGHPALHHGYALKWMTLVQHNVFLFLPTTLPPPPPSPSFQSFVMFCVLLPPVCDS